ESRNSFRNWDWHYTFYSPYFIKLTGRGNYVNAESTETPYHCINKLGNQYADTLIKLFCITASL
ncbi:hypothetical protein, partial [Escherichia coli]